MFKVEKVLKKLKSIQNISLKNLQEYENLIISIYKALVEYKKNYPAANPENCLSRYLPSDIAEEFKPLVRNLKLIQLPDLYTFLLEIEKKSIHLLHRTYPIEILKLINSLLEIENGSSVYNPYPDAYGFAYWFSRHSRATVITVDPYKTEIPVLLNTKLSSKIEFSFKEPLCITDNESYDYSISFVWKSERISLSCEENREISGWKEILLLKHLLSISRKKTLIFLPSSFLIRIQKEFVEIRKTILQYLESIILLPANIFYSSTHAYCIVVLNKNKNCKDRKVLFADLSKFYEISSFGMKNILNYGEAVNVLKGNNNSHSNYRTQISVSELKNLDSYYRLHPLLYLKRNLKYFKLINNLKNTKKLKEIADIIAAPFAKTTIKQLRGKELSVFELQTTDIPESGIVSKASIRKRKIFNLKEYRNAVIKPNDILLSVRGTIGKLGIVSDVPKDEIWIPSQTLVIIRSHYEKLDPHALFIFLRSELGQFLLERTKSGEIQEFISMKLLKELKIPKFSIKQQVKLKEQFRKELENYKLIENLREKIEKEREDMIETLIKSAYD